MKQIQVCARVSLAAALAAGSASYGETVITLSDADVANASEIVKRELLSLRATSTGVLVADLVLSSSTVGALFAELESCAEERTKKQERKKSEREEAIQKALNAPSEHWRAGGMHARPGVLSSPSSVHLDDSACSDPRIVAQVEKIRTHVLPTWLLAWEDHEARETAAKAAVEADKRAKRQADQDALTALVELRGTESQVDRRKAGVLPEDELLDLAREHWIPKSACSLSEFGRIVDSDVSHAEDCSERRGIDYRAEEIWGPWTEAQWGAIQLVTKIYDGAEDVTLATLEHQGRCPECCDEVVRYGIRVRVERHGIMVQREYALPDDDE